MEIQELRALQAISEEGSFRAAADRLHLSPSALRRHIEHLETDIGTQLVHRNSRPVALTLIGQDLVADTRRAADIIDYATTVARRHALNGTRRLRIAHNGASALDIIQKVVTTAIDVKPELSIELHEGPSGDLLNRLDTDRADLAFVRPPIAVDGLTDAWLLDETLVVVLPPKHPLASQKAVRLAQLANDTFVVPPLTQSERARTIVTQACVERGGYQPARTQEADTTASLIALVATGAGIAILPKRSASYYRNGTVTVCRLLDNLPALPLHLAWRSNDHDSTVAAVRNAILEHVGRRKSRHLPASVDTRTGTGDR